MSKLWSPWRRYDDWQPDWESFRETLDGGQAFCWYPIDRYTFEGVVLNTPFRLRWSPPGLVQWATHPAALKEAKALIATYLGNQEAYRKIYDTLPWRSDPHLAQCMKRFPELRILNQPASETLLAFLCSATKQIVQIKEMLTLLRERFGTLLPSAHRSLPDWEAIAALPESALRDCKLGFRAANIKKTANKVATTPTFAAEISALPYLDGKDRLRGLPGVGDKVADCVLLFGHQKLEAFPVDTWILKVMQRHYQLTSWNPKQIAHFGRVHFGAYAGLAQQFLFAWERNFGT